jgi:hypothetical protein
MDREQPFLRFQVTVVSLSALSSSIGRKSSPCCALKTALQRRVNSCGTVMRPIWAARFIYEPRGRGLTEVSPTAPKTTQSILPSDPCSVAGGRDLNGHLTGRARGDTGQLLVGRWVQSGGSLRGSFHFNMSANGCRFRGTYSTDGGRR